MRRRILFASLFGAAGSWPLVARSRTTGQPFRLGVMTRARREERGYSAAILIEELARRGYIDGQNLAVEFRSTEGRPELYAQFAVELVQLGVDAIFAGGGEASARAAQAATRSIPTVIFVDDAVGQGFVTSLARPGGNMTGVSLLATELDGKRQALLGELLPEGALVASLADSIRTPAQLTALERAAAARGQRVVVLQGNTPQSVAAAIAESQAQGARGINVLASSILFGLSKPIAAHADRLGLPAIFQWPDLAGTGGSYGVDALVGYGPRFHSVAVQLAAMMAKIIGGALPADIPVEQPTKFELAVNLKTAKALGLTIPPSILARADEVIE